MQKKKSTNNKPKLNATAIAIAIINMIKEIIIAIIENM